MLLNSKQTLERSLKEHESLKSQLEDVAREEGIKKPEPESVTAASDGADEQAERSEPSDAPLAAQAGHAQASQSEQTTQTDGDDDDETDAAATAAAAAANAAVSEAATVYDASEAPAPESCATSEHLPDRKSVERLLKLLHVVGRYESHSCSALPSEVDYFGKVILGKTSLPEDNFYDALAQSVNDAVLYLEHGEQSDNQVANGTTYKQLRGLVDTLAEDLCQHPTAIKTPNAPPSPQLQINFFADPTAGGAPLEEMSLAGVDESQGTSGGEQRTAPEPDVVAGQVSVDSVDAPASSGAQDVDNAGAGLRGPAVLAPTPLPTLGLPPAPVNASHPLPFTAPHSLPDGIAGNGSTSNGAGAPIIVDPTMVIMDSMTHEPMDQPMDMGLPPQEGEHRRSYFALNGFGPLTHQPPAHPTTRSGIVNVNVLGMHHVMPGHVHTTAAMTQPVVPGNVWSAVPPPGHAMVPQVRHWRPVRLRKMLL